MGKFVRAFANFESVLCETSHVYLQVFRVVGPKIDCLFARVRHMHLNVQWFSSKPVLLCEAWEFFSDGNDWAPYSSSDNDKLLNLY